MDTFIRNNIIESLTYPRLLLENRLDLEGCPYHGHYAPHGSVCRKCSEQYECAWLFSHDAYVDLKQKPDTILADALEFAVHYINGYCASKGHNSTTCTCDSCSWLNNSENLLGQIKDLD